MKAYKKSTFHKLYLIEPELYNKVLPLLNQLDKNELLQLNERYSEEDELFPLDETHSEETITNDIENIKSTHPSYQENPTITSSDPAEAKSPFTQENSFQNHGSEYYPIRAKHLHTETLSKQKKPKKFLCKKCTKSFTTKYSLKRHDKNFHTNLYKETLQNTESVPVDNEPSTTYENNHGIKRQIENPDDYDSQNKRMKQTRGIKRKQEEDDIETDATDFKQPRLETSAMGLSDFSAKRGIKRKINRVSDSDSRKKHRWIDFY